jgi:hypothetical protein
MKVIPETQKCVVRTKFDMYVLLMILGLIENLFLYIESFRKQLIIYFLLKQTYKSYII